MNKAGALLKLAVFDVDGTLIDSQHNIVAAMNAAFLGRGLAAPRAEAIRRIIGLSLVEAVAALLPGQDEALHLAIAHGYKEAFFELRGRPDHSEPLFPGAALALARLEEEGWLLGVATGKSRRGLEAMIERHGFAGRFVTLQSADDNPGKPHPAMLLRALAESGVAAEQAVMIGDTVYDMEMSHKAGIRGIGVGWGYHGPDELKEAGAAALIGDFSELASVAGRLIASVPCA